MTLKEEKLYQKYLYEKEKYESVTDRTYLSFDEWKERIKGNFKLNYEK